METVFAGMDTHKDSLTVAVIDQAGRVQATRQLSNTEAGFASLVSLLRRHRVRRVGIEGSGGYGRAAVIHLAILDSVEVVEVPTLLTARERSSNLAAAKPTRSTRWRSAAWWHEKPRCRRCAPRTGPPLICGH